MTQRKLIMTAGVLLLFFGGLGFCMRQIAVGGENPTMLQEISLKIIDSITFLAGAYLGANVLEKGKGWIEAFKDRGGSPNGPTGDNDA